MTEPYDKAAAGQPITALRWNNLQTQIRDEIEDLKATKLNIAGGTVTGALVVNRAADPNRDPLHLRGTGNTGLRIETGTSQADVAALRFSHGDAGTGWIGTWNNGRMSFSGAMHLVAGRLGLGVDAPADALHLLQGGGILGVRLQTGAGPADWNILRFWHKDAERAFLGTHGATGRFTVNNTLNVLAGRVGVGVGTENTLANTLDVRGDLGVSRSGWHGGLVVNTQHTGWSNAVRDRAEISIDPGSKTLMIVGSIAQAEDDPGNFKWPGMGRRVSVWDRLEVNGHLYTNTFVAGPLPPQFRPVQPIHTTAIAVENGIIQRGGAALGGTADLGLYSQVVNSWIRIVTTNGGVTFRSDGGIGNVANADILPTGDLKVRRWVLAGNFGAGVDVPADLAHLRGSGNIGLRIESGATANDFSVLRLFQGGVQRAALYTNNAGLTIESAGTITANAGLQVKNGPIIPQLGNSGNAGIQFPVNPGGGGGDEAFIRYHVEANETTTFRIGTNNDADDSLRLWQAGDDRLLIQNGQVTIGNGGTPWTIESRALNAAGEIKSFGAGSGLRMSDRAAPSTGARDWVIFPHDNRVWFWQGEVGNIAYQSKETFYTPRLSLPNGVIQRGGDPLLGTADLGLYSQVDQNWIRFVTRNGAFVYFGDGGVGTNAIARIEANGAAWFRGQVRADGGFFPIFSDLRMKTDIEPVASSLGKLMEVRGVRFHWKDESRPAGPHFGVIAQEVEAVFPELVKTDEDGYKRVDYTGLVAPLIEAVREQQQQIAGLRRELAELRERIA